ncbi:hypothetical protein [Crocosphaera sp.]|uniref:hypothetical protein n=1 Tax=Crocosphaera sp. TaxID=2729996 RepID=UPI003F281259
MMFTTNAPLIQKTAQRITRFPFYVRQSSTWLCCLVLTVSSISMSLAQSTSNRQLPPPPLPKMVTPQPSVDEVVPLSVEVTPAEETTTPIKEYTFEAPQNLPAQTINQTPATSEVKTNNSQTNQNPSFYRVEVAGDNSSLLSQVKTIEPMAFIRQSEGVIHAGMFQNSQQAAERVQQLKNQGLPATVVPVYQPTTTSLSVQMKP